MNKIFLYIISMEKGLTLVIPLYNKVKSIRQTLNSVLANHGSYPFKCLIIDDDSTDGSSEIALEYDRSYPDVFQYIKRTHHERKTAVYARNMGIMLADTEYIGFLDADDEICPGFIDRGCMFLDEHPEYSMYGNACIHNKPDNCYSICQFDGSDKIYDIRSFIIAGGDNVHFCANIYKTELVKQVPFIDVYGEDDNFKLTYIYKFQPIYIDTTRYDSMIWNAKYSDSAAWVPPIDKPYPIEIYESVKARVPDFEFWPIYDDDGNLIRINF